MQQPNYSIAALAAAQRAARPASPIRPFRANAGGPFKPAPVHCPSFKAEQQRAERIAAAKRDADTLRASYSTFRERY